MASVVYDLPADQSYGYTYDNMGNIATYTDANGTVTYTYDAQGQLLSATDGTTTYSYTYDTVGNILTANGHTYSYGNADWKDLLTAYDGEAITYDAIGNPLSYYNGTRWTFTWEDGRQLATATDGTTNVSYTYDSDGIRTSKTVNGVTHTYVYASGRLLRETFGDTTLDFFYSNSGQPYALSHNGTTYYYITNLQGDVMSIVDGTGAVVAEYEYDPYGNIISATGELAEVNPLRYRGYVYDQEIGLYYLHSRYYNAKVGRFLNADAFASTGQGVLGTNMFSYCQNNPVMNHDPSGRSSTSSIEQLLSEFVDILNRLVKTIVHYLGPFSDDEKVLIATIAAEGTVTVNGEPVSSNARQAMANVALNRVGSREWKRYKTVADICKETGFDGYGNRNYQKCMDYLNNRDFSNKVYEQVIWDVMKAYSYDITDGCQLYYTPAAMNPAGSVPKWNFGLLTEVSIPGVDPYYEARFFKYS